MDGTRRAGLRGDDERPRGAPRRARERCRSRGSPSRPGAAARTVKALFRTADGHPVEAVLMRYRDGRRSVCVSSQSGCPLTCTFCATGAMRFGRNLRAGRSSTRCSTSGGSRTSTTWSSWAWASRSSTSTTCSPRRDYCPTSGSRPGGRRLDRRLGPRPEALRRRGRGADPPRALAPRGRPAPALRAHAGQRPLPTRRRARRVPALRRAAPPEGVRRVRDARGSTIARAGAGTRRGARAEVFKVNLIPYNPTGMTTARRGTRSRRSRPCSTAPGCPPPCG